MKLRLLFNVWILAVCVGGCVGGPNQGMNEQRSLVLIGDNPLIGPGAEAKEAEDEVLIITADYSPITNSVIAEHVVTYSASDEEDQVVSATRTVRINGSGSSIKEDKDSGGVVSISAIVASREECISPCTIQFSGEKANDSSSDLDNDWLSLGYFWDYDDDQADEIYGTFTRGADFFKGSGGHTRESDTTAMGAHTYICDSGVCEYTVGLSVRNASGDWAVAWKDIIVTSQSTAYAGDLTHCISTSSNFVGCPAGAEQSTTLPATGDFQSNHRYLYRAGERYSSPTCLQYGLEGVTISSFGSGGRAIFDNRIQIGANLNCTAVMNNTSVSNLSNPFWISDITIHGIRLARATMGMSFRNIDFYDLDMDYSKETIKAGGNIYYSGGNACSNRNNLDCENVPLPYGLYMSQIVMKGSDDRDFLPGTNVGLWTTAGVGFVTLIDATLRTAGEHNFRSEGCNRVYVAHSDILGNHIGASSNKHGVTIRPEGYLNADGLNQMRRSTSTSEGKGNIYDSRYVYVFDTYFGEPTASTNNAARLGIHSTNGRVAEILRWVVADNLYFDASAFNSFDVALAGHSLGCYANSTWQAPQRCKDRESSYQAAAVLGELYYNRAIGTDDGLQKPLAPLAPDLY